jgi:hypothetical protein
VRSGRRIDGSGGDGDGDVDGFGIMIARFYDEGMDGF